MIPQLHDLIQRFYGSEASLWQLWQLCLGVRDLEGDLVECGVAMGSGIACMRRACRDKKVWGYDSFQGIQLANPKYDLDQPGLGKIEHRVTDGNYLQSSGVTVHPRSQVEEILKEIKEDDFILVEGWIQNTLPLNSPDKIALLRLDMDLYDPTLFALKELWPKIVKGGVLLVDDFGSCSGVERACRDYFGEIDWHRTGENPAYIIKY